MNFTPPTLPALCACAAALLLCQIPTRAADDPAPPVLDPQDEPIRANNPHLASLEDYANSLKQPAFVKRQPWAKVILPLTPEDDDVLELTEAFSEVNIEFFDLQHAVIFCKTRTGRYATTVGALLALTWTDHGWKCTEAKCFYAYGKEADIKMQEGDYHKWWNTRGPSNEMRAGRIYIITVTNGGAVATIISTTYRLNQKGRLTEYSLPLATEKKHRN